MTAVYLVTGAAACFASGSDLAEGKGLRAIVLVYAGCWMLFRGLTGLAS